jgi:hypothetical protein
VLPIPTFRVREQEIKEQKNRDTTVSPIPRSAGPQQLAQDQAQIEPSDVDQLPFQNVLVAPRMGPPHPVVSRSRKLEFDSRADRPQQEPVE